MVQYIDKSSLVVEIERRIKTNKECMLGLRNLDYYQGKVDALNETISFINTLEVKEVDLDKEIDLVEDKYRGFESLSRADIIDIAKHFYELGHTSEELYNKMLEQSK